MRRLLILAVLLLTLLPVSALADGDPLLPDRPAAAPAYSAKLPLYDDPRFEPWDYTFEGQDWNRADYATIYFWMNQLQIAKAWALKLGIRTVEYALQDDLVGPLIAPAGALSDRLHQALWSAPGPSLLLGGLGLAALWALWLHLRGRASRAWGALGSSALILMLAAVAAGAGQQALQTGLSLSRGVAVELFSAASEENLVARGGDAAWRALVYEPWLTGELSEQGRATYRSPDGLDGGNFLAMSVTQRQTACLYNITQAQTNCPWWELDYLPRRMLLTIWTAAAGFSTAGALALLGGSIILAQLTLLLFLGLAPVWLMAALWWPEAGLRLVKGVLLRAFGALVVQGVLAAALALFLALSDALWTTFHSAGWMMTSLPLTALAWLVIRYRYTWWQPLTMVVERIQKQTAPVLAKSGDRSPAQARALSAPAFAEMAPAFSVLSETLIMPTPEGTVANQERARVIRPSPMAIFERQMERVRAEITLRQETQRQEHTLQQIRERSARNVYELVTAPPADNSHRRQVQTGKSPSVTSISPPRPKE